MKCAECGAQTAEEAQFCARCGAPVTQRPLVAAVPAAGGSADHVETAPGPAKDARPWPAAVRWFFLICLILFLILFTIGQIGVVRTAQGTGLHDTMVSVSWLSIFGALLFLILFECARKQFAGAQLGWAMVPLFSFGLLAFVPFLWLALVRRRVRDWVVFAVYLAAAITVIVALSSVPANTSITGLPAVTVSLLLVIAPAHAVLAFSLAAKVPSWREAYPGWPASKRQQPVTDAVATEDRQQDAELGHSKPTPTDSGGATTN
jgi:zinc-ribbon domain